MKRGTIPSTRAMVIDTIIGMDIITMMKKALTPMTIHMIIRMTMTTNIKPGAEVAPERLAVAYKNSGIKPLFF